MVHKLALVQLLPLGRLAMIIQQLALDHSRCMVIELNLHLRPEEGVMDIKMKWELAMKMSGEI